MQFLLTNKPLYSTCCYSRERVPALLSEERHVQSSPVNGSVDSWLRFHSGSQVLKASVPSCTLVTWNKYPRCIMTRLTWESKKHTSVISKCEKVVICSLWKEKGKRCVHLPAPRAISTPTWSYSEAPGYKGQPKNSSAMTHPNDHISIASQKGKPRMISGALQRKRSENISKGSRAARLA